MCENDGVTALSGGAVLLIILWHEKFLHSSAKTFKNRHFLHLKYKRFYVQMDYPCLFWYGYERLAVILYEKVS